VGAELRMTIERLPKFAHGFNVRKYLPQSLWGKIRESILQINCHRCSICGSHEGLECHEKWDFDYEQHIQILVNIEPLCYLCHGVKHLGFTANVKRKNLDQYIDHFMRVNNCDRSTYKSHAREILGLSAFESVEEILRFARHQQEMQKQQWKLKYAEHLPYHTEVVETLKKKGIYA
jgi:hypothetical protein